MARRCRWPPLNSRGRRSAQSGGSPPAPSVPARAGGARRAGQPRTTSGSATISAARMPGFNVPAASWKTICTLRVQADFAGVRLLEARQAPRQGGFARAGFPHQRHRGARRDVEIDAVERRGRAAVALDEPARFSDRFSRHGGSTDAPPGGAETPHAVRSAQRGAKGQPGAGAAGSGGAPGMARAADAHRPGRGRPPARGYRDGAAPARPPRTPSSTMRPAYITKTRSARPARAAGLCVTSSMAQARSLQSREHRQDFGLHDGVERGGGLVRHHQRRLERHRLRDRHPLALASAQLVGVGIDDARGVARGRPRRAPRGMLAHPAARPAAMGAHHFGRPGPPPASRG